MKRCYTEAKKARRCGASVKMSIYSLPVYERRKMGIQAPDAAEYDQKHGIMTGANRGRKKLFGFLHRIVGRG